MTTIIYKSSIPQRVDKYLSVKYLDFSRRYFQDGLKDGKILVNGRRKSPSYKLKEGDKIEIKLSLKKTKEITELPTNNKIKIEVVAKYPDFFIINKPAGLTVHPSIFDVQNNSIPPTLAGGLLALDGNLKNVGEKKDDQFDITRPGIVHRLDKDTSGLMIIPRTQKAFMEFKEKFKNREVVKTYLALCWNMQTQKDKLKLQKFEAVPLDESERGEVRLLNFCNKKGSIKYSKIDRLIGKSKKDHTKQSTNNNPSYLINPKEATTFYAMLWAGQFGCNYRINNLKKQAVPMALIQVQPKTGRKHQVRVHLGSVGLPLVGDKKYASKILKNCNKNFKHHLLHAYKLGFTYQGKKYSFKADLPKYFGELMG